MFIVIEIIYSKLYYFIATGLKDKALTPIYLLFSRLEATMLLFEFIL